MTGILGQLKWESLKKMRKDNRLILLYKGLKGKARILTDDLIPKTRRCGNQHSMVFQIPSASKDAYMNSFFPRTIRVWNDLPESIYIFSFLPKPMAYDGVAVYQVLKGVSRNKSVTGCVLVRARAGQLKQHRS